MNARRSIMKSASVFAGAVILALMFTAGCAFDDGDPALRVSGQLTTSLDLPSDRLDGEQIATANDFLLTIDQLDVVIAQASLSQSASVADTDFDPANPPPGYSLCHNGHCHADDGRLVDYDVIIRELSGSDQSSGISTVVLNDAATSIRTSDETSPFNACSSSGCALPRSTISALDASIEELRIVADVEDVRTGDRQRTTPFRLDVTFEVDARVGALLDIESNYRSSNDVELDATLTIHAAAFDAVAWDSLSDLNEASLEQAETALRQALQETSSLSVSVNRNDF